MSDGDVLSAIVCASDAMVRTAASTAVEQEGYRLAGQVGSGPDAISLAELIKPDLLVIDNDLHGQPGVEWVPELRETLPLAAILLIANDEHIRERAMEYGAFGVVYRTQLTELNGALQRARAWLDDPELHGTGERRTGKDRRQGQDWSRVTSERRRGGDRRAPGSGSGSTSPDL
jgi:DNA-binding NarL/FixJ family response regulator